MDQDHCEVHFYKLFNWWESWVWINIGNRG